MKLETIFTDKIVFQREMPLRVFGNGDGHAKVSFLGNTAEGDFTGGKWLLELPAAPVGEGYEMTIELDGETTVLHDVAVGEVYILSGQSNMEMPLFRTNYGFREAENADEPHIRFFTVPRRYIDGRDILNRHFETLSNHDTPWCECSPETAPHFSAIGYYFARFLRKHSGVPVGVISCSWGGLVINTFIDKAEFLTDPALAAVQKRYEAAVAKYTDEEAKAIFEKFVTDLEAFCRRDGSSTYENAKKYGVGYAVAYDCQFTGPMTTYGKYSPHRPGGVFETMVTHIAPFSARGVLWYQGESSCDDRDYFEKYRALLRSWRRAFKNDKLPFYAVELADFRRLSQHEPQNPNKGFAFLREQQQRAARELEYSYLATARGCGDEYDIHPRDKREVAERLWRLALKYDFGVDTRPESPEIESYSIDGDSVTIKIKNTEKLFVQRAARDFYICGEDKCFYPATAKVSGNVITLKSASVPSPVAARYCFFDYNEGGNIYGDNGIPLVPFRTDDFAEVTYSGI